MKHTMIIAALAATMTASAQLHISTPTTSLLLNAEPGERFEYMYYGAALADTDIPVVAESEKHVDAYPVYGMDTFNAYTLAATHADGSMATDMRVDKVSESTDKDGSKVTRVSLKDTLYPFYIDVCYRTWPACDVIETWTEIRNNENKAVTLTEFPSAYLPVRRGNVWLSHIDGAWGNEGHLTHEPLTPGIKTIRNIDGARNSQNAHSEIMLSLDGKPQERTGRTIGAVLCYSGNYDISINTDASAWHRLTAGIDAHNSAYRLAKGETFETPAVALTYSERGTSGVSRNIHRWGRDHRLQHADRERPVLLNSWEGIYFDVNEPVVNKMMTDIADMGGELFVLDDGWFGTKYPRNGDKWGLGDW